MSPQPTPHTQVLDSIASHIEAIRVHPFVDASMRSLADIEARLDSVVAGLERLAERAEAASR